MTSDYISFNQVSFKYDSMTSNLVEGLSFQLGNGWTGIVGANGSGKTTLLKLASGLLDPGSGNIQQPKNRVYCPQITDRRSDDMPRFLSDRTREAQKLKSLLKIDANWHRDWDHISIGERKRLQIGMALWYSPTLLAIDEPSNHLDTEGRTILLEALQNYRGIGLLICHDRDILDALCTRTIYMDPPEAFIRNGNYSISIQEMERERQNLEKTKQTEKKKIKQLKREAAKSRQLASSANKRRSKRGLGKKDNDSKSKLDLVRVSGKDGSDGRRLNQLESRISKAEATIDDIMIKKRYNGTIQIPGKRYHRNILLYTKASRLKMGAERTLVLPELTIGSADRIGIHGKNGSGKSTFMNHLFRECINQKLNILYIPQEIDQVESREILKTVTTMPAEDMGCLMTIISCLGSRPSRLLESQSPSPGETRKLKLAIGMLSNPNLILFDEPTNHLDLPSIQSMETALAATEAALIIISHDRRFLQQTTRSDWHIAISGFEHRLIC